jgi:hypothetical protein
MPENQLSEVMVIIPCLRRFFHHIVRHYQQTAYPVSGMSARWCMSSVHVNTHTIGGVCRWCRFAAFPAVDEAVLAR